METGLLLVDIQNDYFPNGRLALSGMDAAVQRAFRLLSFFRERHRPSFHVRHIATEPDATFFQPDTVGVEINHRVKPLDGEVVITKRFPNSFRETDLAAALEKAGIQKLVICGAMSHMCIDATTRAAADLGFSCIVIHDACATRDLVFETRKIIAKDVHGAFMAALGSAYAKIMSCTEYLHNP